MAKSIDAFGADLKQMRREGGKFLNRASSARDHAVDMAPELARQARAALDEHLETLRDQGRDAASAAGDQLEAARGYMVEHVQERPLTATLAALGLGVLFGLVLAGSRK